MGIIHFSEGESEILGLRIGRCELKEHSQVGLVRDEVFKQNLDLCRIKVSGDHADLYIQLEKLGFPYFILNVVQSYEKASLGGYQVSDKLKFQRINSVEDQEALENVIRACFSDYPGTFFTNPYLTGLITPEQEIQAITSFVISSLESSNYWIRLVKYEDLNVGFVMYRVSEIESFGELFGIIPEFRRNALSKEVGALVLNTFRDKRVVNHVKIQNIPSVKTHIKLGDSPKETIFNIHLVSLLRLNDDTAKERELLSLDELSRTSSSKTYRVMFRKIDFHHPLRLIEKKINSDVAQLTVTKIFQNKIFKGVQYDVIYGDIGPAFHHPC